MVKWHKANPEQRIYVPLKDGKKSPDAEILQAEDIRRIREGKDSLSLEDEKRFLERNRNSSAWRQLAIF